MTRPALFLSLVILLSFFGCAAPRVARADASPIVATTRIESDVALEGRIQLLDPHFERQGATSIAVFHLRLAEGRELDCFVHVDWFDSSTAPILGLPESWTPLHLVNGSPTTLRVPAPTSDARSFRLRFQRPELVR